MQLRVLLTSLLLLVILSATAQIPTTDGRAHYSVVTTVDGMNKDELYLAALAWVNKTYNSGKTVTQTANQDGGMIIGKALSNRLLYNNMGMKKDAGHFAYTFTIQTKDGRYKVDIESITYEKGEMVLKPGADLAEDFPHNWTGLIGDNKQTRREWLSMQGQAHAYFTLLLEDLAAHMQKAKQASAW
ncbi:DUF4468 domain-containing protein [Pontibacter virosus]|uniref:Uncharacterized protein with TBP-like fold DUF4468 n=1 Tax=Pontibacter virosus TaxID=1765052 RepID=A0A2U1B3J3_9BACT|nr:DUF4468 domain-containing protein [Pontibacter virosus]PVY43249.1 uncharacterized protein with TBP-like fold DUF4468 [Pontibacter virosus]